MVMSKKTDPFQLDTTANHRDGQWLREQMRLPRSTTAIHNRGIHYMIAASANVLLPNGERYINDKTRH